MPRERLDLFKFAARHVAQPRARAAQVVWSQSLDAGACRRGPDDIPRSANPVAPNPPRLVDREEDATFGDAGRARRGIYSGLHPGRDRHRADMTAFANEIGDHSIFLALLNRFNHEAEQLAAAQATADQHG
jgi:hypothetical protein